MTPKHLVANVVLMLSALLVLAFFAARQPDMTEMLTDSQSALFQPGKAFEKNAFARFYNLMM